MVEESLHAGILLLLELSEFCLTSLLDALYFSCIHQQGPQLRQEEIKQISPVPSCSQLAKGAEL